MQALSLRSGGNTPEAMIGRLARQLRRHALWDVFLVLLPAGTAAVYCCAAVYRSGWISGTAFAAALLAIAGAVLAIALVAFIRQTPAGAVAAHLIDHCTDGGDRFITLATIEPGAAPPPLMNRLRTEALALLDRVDLERDFPYAVKRSFYWSFGISVAFALLFRIVLPVVVATVQPPSAPERLRELAERMTERPRLSAVVERLRALAANLENPQITAEKKKAEIQQTQQVIAQEQQRGESEENRDLLAEAATTLESVDREGAGKREQRDPNNGGGELKSNLPERGEGQRQGDTESGAGQAETKAQPDTDRDRGQAAQGAPDQPNNPGAQRQAQDGQPDRADSRGGEQQKDQEKSGKTQGNREDLGGRSKASEEVPQGAPPADRMSAGEGKNGIKGAQYVTVQLPEEAAAERSGKGADGAESKGNKVGARLPVSNTPLPAHLPDAPGEKQHVPLEYRGILR